MSGVDDAIYRLRMDLFHNHSELTRVSSHLADGYRQWDALQVERARILDEFLSLGITPEEVIWDLS